MENKRSVDDLDSRLGLAVKRFRGVRRMTQVDLAEAAGCTQGNISLIESGRYAKLAVLAEIAYALGYDLHELVKVAETSGYDHG